MGQTLKTTGSCSDLRHIIMYYQRNNITKQAGTSRSKQVSFKPVSC